MTTQYVPVYERDEDGEITYEQVGIRMENEIFVVVSPEKYIDNPPWRKIYEGFVSQTKYMQSVLKEMEWFRDTILLVKVDKSKE